MTTCPPWWHVLIVLNRHCKPPLHRQCRAGLTLWPGNVFPESSQVLPSWSCGPFVTLELDPHLYVFYGQVYVLCSLYMSTCRHTLCKGVRTCQHTCQHACMLVMLTHFMQRSTYMSTCMLMSICMHTCNTDTLCTYMSTYMSTCMSTCMLVMLTHFMQRC